MILSVLWFTTGILKETYSALGTSSRGNMATRVISAPNSQMWCELCIYLNVFCLCVVRWYYLIYSRSASLDVEVNASGLLKGELARTKESGSEDEATRGDDDVCQETDTGIKEEGEEEEGESKGDSEFEEEGEEEDREDDEDEEGENEEDGVEEKGEEEEREKEFGVAGESDEEGKQSIGSGGIQEESDKEEKGSRKGRVGEESEEEERDGSKTSDVAEDRTIQHTAEANTRTEGDIRRLVRRGLKKKRKGVGKDGGHHARAKENKRVAAGGQRRTKKGNKMKIKEMTSVGLF